MASLSDRQNSSDFFESRSPRTSPRPSENAPVLFRLPNMRIDAPHGAKTAEKGTLSDSRADQVRNENDNLRAGKGIDSFSSSIATSVASSSTLDGTKPSDPVISKSPTYTPVPSESQNAAITQVPTKKWYAGWSNRLIIVLLLVLIGFLTIRSFRQPNQDVAGKIMQEQGLTDETLVQDVQLPSSPSLSSQGPVVPANSQPNWMAANNANPSSSGLEPTPNTNGILIDAPNESNSSSGKPTNSGESSGLSETPTLQFGNPGSSTAQNSTALNGNKTDQRTGESSPRSTSSLDQPLEAPPLSTIDTSDNKRLSQVNGSGNSNPTTLHGAEANADERAQATEPQIAMGNTNPRSSITETQYESFPIDTFLARRAEFANAAGSAPTYRTASASPSTNLLNNNSNAASAIPTNETRKYRPVGTEMANEMTATMPGTPLTGQAYPPTSSPNPAITIPTSGPIGPPITSAPNAANGQAGNQAAQPRAPYQPIGNAIAPNGWPTNQPNTTTPTFNGQSQQPMGVPQPQNQLIWNMQGAAMQAAQNVQGAIQGYGVAPNSQPQQGYAYPVQPSVNPIGLIPGTQPYYPPQTGGQQPMQQPNLPAPAPGYGGSGSSQPYVGQQAVGYPR